MSFEDLTGWGAVILGGVLLGAGISFWIWAVAGRRDAPVARVYRWLVASNGALCLVAAVKYLAPTTPTAFALEVVYNLLMLAGATLSLLFVVVYVGKGDWLTRRRVALLAVEPLAVLAAMATDPLHGRLLTGVHTVRIEGLTVLKYGLEPLMVAHLLYATALSAAVYVLLGWFCFRTRTVYRTQAVLIFLGSLGIPIAAILYPPGVTPIDLTPFALAINGVVVWVALFRYDFLDVVPLAADVLVEEMADAVIVTGADGEVLDVNGSAERLFGAGTDPVGRPLATVAPRLADALDDEESFVYATEEGSRTFDPSVTVIRDQYGIERGSLIVLHDVTEQVRRQAELERRNERLDEFASVVSHDLRNPLAIADGYVDLAREEDETAHLDRAADALDRMNVLVDDLLTLARNGRSVGETDPVPLRSVAAAAWANVETDATLVNEVDGTVEADERRLQQLFENLFRNAVEHAGPDLVRVGRTADGFYVEDDGPGVPAADRDRVFEHGHTSSSSGTGLGLAIVRSIADAHGWTVSLVEGRDGGARFEFTGVASAPPTQRA